MDEADLLELSERWARNIVTGLARIEGRSVGIVANQPLVLTGVLDSDASRKAARFCDAFEMEGFGHNLPFLAAVMAHPR